MPTIDTSKAVADTKVETHLITANIISISSSNNNISKIKIEINNLESITIIKMQWLRVISSHKIPVFKLFLEKDSKKKINKDKTSKEREEHRALITNIVERMHLAATLIKIL